MCEENKFEHNYFVTVLSTGDQTLIAVAKSILEAAGIHYIVKGEKLQDLFGVGRIGWGFNPIVGPVEIQVTRDNEEKAKQLLEDLREG